LQYNQDWIASPGPMNCIHPPNSSHIASNSGSFYWILALIYFLIRL
jgi:hypothetical protein